MNLHCQRGMFHIPMLLALTLISLAGFGSWGLLRRWRHLTESQLRLDRCVGQTALGLKRKLQRIESANLQIQGLRAAAAAATLVGESVPFIEASQALAGWQDAELLAWQVKQAEWLVRRGCQGEASWLSMNALPSMKWTPRLPADALGAHPLSWQLGAEKKLRIELRHSPRAAAAEIKNEGTQPHALPTQLTSSTHWKATWVVPIGTGPF